MRRLLLCLAAIALATPSCDMAPNHVSRVYVDQSTRTATRSSKAHSNEWLMYQFTPSHNAVFPSPDLRVTWNLQFSDRINGGFAVVDGILYSDNFDHSINAIDMRTGRILWKAVANNVVMSTPIVAHGVVLVGTGHDGWLNPGADDPDNQIWGRPAGDAVYALSARTGRMLWKYQTIGDDMASPAIDGNVVVFANGDLHAYGLDLNSGALKWKTDLQGVASMDSVTVHDGVAFIGTCRAAPHRCWTQALDVQSGRIRWTNPIGSADASVSIWHNIIFAVTLNPDSAGRYNQGGTSTVAGIDERTGITKWTWTSPSGPCTFVGSGEHEIAGTVADGEYFQSVGCGSQVLAFDVRSGKIRWSYPTWAHVKMSPVVYRGKVFFGDTNGVLYILNERTGRMIKAVSFDQMFTTAPPVIVGETIFLACSSEIYAFPIDADISPLEISSVDHSRDSIQVTDLRVAR